MQCKIIVLYVCAYVLKILIIYIMYCVMQVNEYINNILYRI